MQTRYIAFTLLTAVSLTLSGCFNTSLDQQIAEKFFETQDYYYLSPSNDALSSTRLFSKRTSEAVEVWNLIDKKGFPDAMAVRSLEPLALSLAYKKPKQTYLCTETKTGWIITGPAKLDRKIKLPDSAKDDIPYMKKSSLHGKSKIAPAAPLATASAVQSALKHPEQPQQLSLNELKKIKSLIATLGTEPAVMTSNGDIAHTSTSNEETINAIALWYTLDPNSAKIIARINQIKGKDLTSGEKVTIPSYLVRNTLKYSPEFQKAFPRK